jgi:hypothetical protein
VCLWRGRNGATCWFLRGIGGRSITLRSLAVGLVEDDLALRQFLLDHLASRDAPGTWWNMFDMLHTRDSAPASSCC